MGQIINSPDIGTIQLLDRCQPITTKMFKNLSSIGEWGQTNIFNLNDQYTSQLPKLKNWYTKQLDLIYTPQNGIIKSIQNIRFPLLQRIFLGCNQIQSIQGLTRIRTPQLTVLNLNTNLITNINSLKKLCKNQLTNILLVQNNINEIDVINQFNIPQLKTLGLQTNQFNKLQSNALTALAKLRRRTTFVIQIKAKGRFYNDKFVSTIKIKMGDKVFDKKEN